jgi:hypothetical protein
MLNVVLHKPLITVIPFAPGSFLMPFFPYLGYDLVLLPVHTTKAIKAAPGFRSSASLMCLRVSGDNRDYMLPLGMAVISNDMMNTQDSALLLPV